MIPDAIRIFAHCFGSESLSEGTAGNKRGNHESDLVSAQATLSGENGHAADMPKFGVNDPKRTSAMLSYRSSEVVLVPVEASFEPVG